MYKEYPKFYNYETKKYGRKSCTDDPLLSTDEILEKHSKIVEEYAIKYLSGPKTKRACRVDGPSFDFEVSYSFDNRNQINAFF